MHMISFTPSFFRKFVNVKILSRTPSFSFLRTFSLFIILEPFQFFWAGENLFVIEEMIRGLYFLVVPVKDDYES